MTDLLARARDLPAVRAVVDHEATRLLVAGVVVGILGGSAAGAFDFVMIGVGNQILGTAEPAVTAPVWWRALLGPAFCGLVAGPLIAWGTTRGRPQSVPDVMERVQLDAPSLTLRDGLISALGAAFVVGGGHSGGREGPIVQVSASLAAAVCGPLGLPPRHFRTLTAAGAAAGVAASFNTPLGGAFFALEILLGDFGVESFAPVVAATVTGTVVGQALLGDRIALHLPAFTLESPFELAFYLVLGGVSGLVAVGFKRAILWGSDASERTGIPLPLRSGAAGVLLGVSAALGGNELMGNGYAWMEQSIADTQTVTLALLMVLLVTKVAATTVTFGGRGGAGLFAPSLYLGAVTGLIVGQIATVVAPGEVPSAGAYGMVGMGAVAAGVLHAPITMTLMLFEMTGNYRVILPLLVSLASAGLVSRLLGSESIYESELRRRGITLARPHERRLLDDLTVGDLMRDVSIDGMAPTFLTDADGRLVTGGESTTTSEGIRADQPLATVVPSFFNAQVAALPVVDTSGKLIGVLHERDVIAAYHRFLERRDTLLARFESGPAGARTTGFIELPEGYGVEVIEVREGDVGRSLRELDLARRDGSLVLAHNVWDAEAGTWHRRPVDAARTLARGDRLVVLGPTSRAPPT